MQVDCKKFCLEVDASGGKAHRIKPNHQAEQAEVVMQNLLFLLLPS